MNKKESDNNLNPKKDEQSEEILKSKNSKSQNNQVTIAVVLMILVFLIMAIVPFVKSNYVVKFEYADLEFEKIKTENIVTYKTILPAVDSEGRLFGVEWIFRNDPRELDDIIIEIPNKTITFQKDKTTYLSLEKDAPACEDNILSVFTLLNFLDDFGGLDIQGAVSDKDYANETNHPYITCENSPRNTVILLKSGNQNLLNKTSENCYELQYKDCDINRVTEKFIYTILERYMKIFKYGPESLV